MTVPNKSTQVRRAYYGSGSPVSPAYYDDQYDSLPNTDVLDTVLLYGNQFQITGYRWDENLSYQVPTSNNDAIGDALRNDLISNWTLNQISGIRFDSKDGHDLLESIDAVPSDMGMFGLAAQFPDSLDFYYQLYADLTGEILPDGKLACAFQFQSNMEDGGDSPSLLFEIAGYFRAELLGTNTLNIVTNTPQSTTYNSGWNIIFMEMDGSDYSISLNGVVFTTGTLTQPPDPLSFIYVGGNEGNGVPLTYKVDNPFILPRLFTANEKNYLYNSGNGRTLYP